MYNMTVGLIDNIRQRELNEKGLTVADTTIDRLLCHRQDEHHIEAQEFGDSTPPLMCRFSKVSPHVLAVADEDGGIIILNTLYQGIQSVQQDWLAHSNAVFDVDWMPAENKLLTGSGDQTVALWDVENEEKLTTFRGHTSSVKTTRFNCDNKWLFATGARDGNIMIYDCRVKAKDGFVPSINTIRNAHKTTSGGSTHKKKKTNTENPQSVTALVFQDDNTLISTGSVDGSIRVWDLRKTYTVLKADPLPRHIFQYAGSGTRSYGFSSLVLDVSRTRLFASCMDNVIYQYDTAAFNAKPVCSYRGHKNTTFYIKTSLSPCDNFLLSGSSDNEAYIWRVSTPHQSPWKLQGQCGEVSAVDWCSEDIGKLATVSDDSTVRIWRVDTCHTAAQTPPFGDVVGRSYRQHDMGVSARCGSEKKLAPLTPRKGAMIPESPVKKSPSLARSLANLPAQRITPQGGSQPSSSQRSTASISPSIVAWVNRNSKPQPSPAKKTPKKLIITPKKSTEKKNHGVEAVIGGSTPAVGGSTPAVGGSTPVVGGSTVKRKLYGGSPEGAESKRQKLDDGYFLGHVQDENSCDGFTIPQSPRLLSPRQHHSPRLMSPRQQDSLRCLTPRQHSISPQLLQSPRVRSNHKGNYSTTAGRDSVTPLKDPLGEMTPSKGLLKNLTPLRGSSSPAQFQSPTADLPNYVMDPQPRTPVSRRPEPGDTPKTPNWLAQLRLQKQNSESKQPHEDKEPGSKESTPRGEGKDRTPRCDNKGRTPRCESKDVTPGQETRARRTPASRRKQQVARDTKRSILQFFSPKTDKTAASQRASETDKPSTRGHSSSQGHCDTSDNSDTVNQSNRTDNISCSQDSTKENRL